MDSNRPVQLHGDFDSETLATYDEIRSKASKEWLKPSSVSLARLDAVKAKVYNIGLGDASHLKPQASSRINQEMAVPMTPVATQRSAWGSTASIPDLIRQYSRPESAKTSNKRRPPSARRPRPHSAKELSDTAIGNIRLTIAVKGSQQNLQSRPGPRDPALPPGCVPYDPTRPPPSHDATPGQGRPIQGQGRTGQSQGRRPQLSVTRHDLERQREEVSSTYRQPPGSPVSDVIDADEVDLAAIINETADQRDSYATDLFYMPEFLRRETNTAERDVEDDSGVYVPVDDGSGDDELIETLTAAPRAKRRPTSAKSAMHRKPPLKPRAQSAKPLPAKAQKTSPPGPIHLQLPSADMPGDEDQDLDTERLIRTLHQTANDEQQTIGFTVKSGFNFVHADVKVEPLGKTSAQEPIDTPKDVTDELEPITPSDEVRKPHSVTFKLNNDKTTPRSPKPNVKYSGKRSIKNVKSRVDSGISFTSSPTDSVRLDRKSADAKERPKSAVTTVTVTYDDSDDEKEENVPSMIAKFGNKDHLDEILETKTVSKNVNKNHFASLEPEERTVTTKFLTLDGCEVTLKQSIPTPAVEVRNKHDYVIDDRHKPPRKQYKPSLPKPRTTGEATQPELVPKPEAVLQPEQEIKVGPKPEMEGEQKPEVEISEPVEESEMIELPRKKPTEMKPKARNRPSLMRKPPPKPEKKNYSSYSSGAGRPKSAPGKSKAKAAPEPVYIWTRSHTDLDVDTPAMRECKNMHFKLLEKGVNIPVETLQRALLPPQEASVYVDPKRNKSKMAPLPSPSDGLLNSPAVWLAAEYKKLRLAERALERANERMFLQQRAEEKKAAAEAKLAARALAELTDPTSDSDKPRAKPKRATSAKKKRVKSASAVRSG